MNGTLLLVMAAIVVLMLFNNIRKIKEMRKDNRYVDAYMKVLRGEEDAKDNLNSYIEAETNETTKNRALIVKAYVDDDPKSVIEAVNYDLVFKPSGQYDTNHLVSISDTFIWLILALSKYKDNREILDLVYSKVFNEEFNKHVEYLVFKAAYEIISNKEEKDVSFLTSLLSGDYAEYKYDKQLIGIYKKMSVALLVYNGNAVDSEDEDMLKDFVLTQVGGRFLENLNLKEKYIVKEETVQENNEVEEKKEEDNQE
ncbi:MAG: hypothetical protein IJH31_01115 [Erysipelotrichaceae bacterium]|nr:hypothetical protein [Erysipelotrichaceae bacterium]